jgi:hypothetical protein
MTHHDAHLPGPAHQEREPGGREPPLNRLIRIMLVNLGAGLVIAAVTLICHDQIVAAQLASAHPAAGAVAQTRNSLSITLWTRPAPAVAVAILYPLFIRRLRQHQRRGYRRVVIVGLLQLAALIWYLLGADYPWWLRVLQGAQALIVLAVLWAASRPALRALFGYQPPGPQTRYGRRAALLLVVLAPLVAELTWGSTRASQIGGLLLFWPGYGAGALLIRELARRSGRGQPTILLLGVAYGLIEEGLTLQSLTSRTIYPDMTGLAPQVGGVNLAYTLMVLVYHAVFSIGIPVALAEITHPRARHTPWLRTPGLAVTAVIALLGFGLFRLVPLTADPHYLQPWPDDLVIGALVVVLGVVALRVLPPVRSRDAQPAAVPPLTARDAQTAATQAPLTAQPAAIPAPLTVGLLAFGATVAFLGLLMPLPGAHHAGYAPSGPAAWYAIAVAAVIAAGTAVLAARWTRSPAWRDQHTVAALTAALLGHTLIGFLTLAHTPLDRIALAAFGVAEVLLMLRLVRAIAGRAAGNPDRPRHDRPGRTAWPLTG